MTHLDIETPQATEPAASPPPTEPPAPRRCLECQRVGGHKATCPAVEPPCTCQLADCGDCMRRPGARLTHGERAARALPASHRRAYPV